MKEEHNSHQSKILHYQPSTPQAPTEEKEDVFKDYFYAKLGDIYDKIFMRRSGGKVPLSPTRTLAPMIWGWSMRLGA